MTSDTEVTVELCQIVKLWTYLLWVNVNKTFEIQNNNIDSFTAVLGHKLLISVDKVVQTTPLNNFIEDSWVFW